MSNKTKGYVIVASRTPEFYSLGINLVESILDYHPEAKITLVTESKFLDGRESVCDQVIHCDDHYRAKLWGMARTPYDITFYVDADMECVHEDIATVFDNLQDYDMMFTPISKVNEHHFQFRYMNEKAKAERNEYYTFQHNGGVCLYDTTNPRVQEFMHDWQKYYYAQRNKYEWWPLNEQGEKDFETFPAEMRFWDQFTLWWLIFESGKYDDLKIGFFDDWARWNYYVGYTKDHQNGRIPIENPVVLYHYSNSAPKFDERRVEIEGSLT